MRSTMSSSDINRRYGYLLGTINLVRREIKSGANPHAIVEAIAEIVFREPIDEMLREFNLK